MSNVVYVAEPSIAAGAQSLTCAPGNTTARLSCHYFQCRFYITLSGSSRNSNSNKEKRQKKKKKTHITRYAQTTMSWRRKITWISSVLYTWNGKVMLYDLGSGVGGQEATTQTVFNASIMIILYCVLQ